MKPFVLLLALFCACREASAAPKDVNFKASINEIEKAISSHFPTGMDRSVVVDALTAKFEVKPKTINISRIDKKPIETMRDGKKHFIYSSVNTTLAEYRSIAALFAKTWVTVEFYFDANEQLLFYRVWVARGPEL